MTDMNIKNLMTLPLEIQIEVINQIVLSEGMNGYKNICSANHHFNSICKKYQKTIYKYINKFNSLQFKSGICVSYNVIYTGYGEFKVRDDKNFQKLVDLALSSKPERMKIVNSKYFVKNLNNKLLIPASVKHLHIDEKDFQNVRFSNLSSIVSLNLGIICRNSKYKTIFKAFPNLKMVQLTELDDERTEGQLLDSLQPRNIELDLQDEEFFSINNNYKSLEMDILGLI